MNIKKRIITATAVLSTSLLAVACGNSGAGNSTQSNKTTITFWYSLTGGSKKALQKLTADFEKANPDINVKLQSQGGNYSDLQSKITSSLQSPKDLPTITQAYPGWLYQAAKNDMLVKLDPYVKKAYGSYEQSGIQQGLWDGAKINGAQYGVPFNKSVEVLFYNQTLLKKYGVKVPTTMQELEQASKTIYEKSNHKVRGMGFDSLNNYYMLSMKERKVNFTNKLSFSSHVSKEVINWYANGVHVGYFMMAGTEKYMSTPFDAGRVAMFIGSTANEAYVKSGMPKGQEYGIAKRPSSVNIQQGTDIYMFKQASQKQRTAAFKYLQFLTSAKSQRYWSNKTGYMPVQDSVLNSASFKASKLSKVPAILADTAKNLYYLPVEKNATAAYDQVNANMQTILAQAGKSSNWNSQVSTGANKLAAAWKQ